MYGPWPPDFHGPVLMSWWGSCCKFPLPTPPAHACCRHPHAPISLVNPDTSLAVDSRETSCFPVRSSRRMLPYRYQRLASAFVASYSIERRALRLFYSIWLQPWRISLRNYRTVTAQGSDLFFLYMPYVVDVIYEGTYYLFKSRVSTYQQPYISATVAHGTMWTYSVIFWNNISR